MYAHFPGRWAGLLAVAILALGCQFARAQDIAPADQPPPTQNVAPADQPPARPAQDALPSDQPPPRPAEEALPGGQPPQPAQEIVPAGQTPAQAPQEAAPEDQTGAASGMTVLARGPVHEAYARPVTATPQPGLTVSKKPPDPIQEEPPDERPEGENVVWIPGYWAWSTSRDNFIWVSGFWRVPPPGRRWVPGYWNQVEDGWQWVSGFWAPADQESLTYLDAPPASQDDGPDTAAPSDDNIYVPGVWRWRETRYVWQPGFWMDGQPNWVWVPAHYCWTPAGYIFIDGFWDYILQDRGLLFAPVAFDQPLWDNPDWYYQPDCVVRLTPLLAALFVRPIYCHYYFGDYYGDQYQSLGFYPWIVYGPRYFDPLFSYYSWANADNYGWYDGLRNTYLGRLHGDMPRPPHTLGQQRNMLRSGGFGASAAGRNGFRGRNSLQMVSPLGQYHSNRMRTTSVSAQERRAQGGRAQGFQQTRRQRATTESSFSRGGGAAGHGSCGCPPCGRRVGREALSGGSLWARVASRGWATRSAPRWGRGPPSRAAGRCPRGA
jgi:hypothetical protein